MSDMFIKHASETKEIHKFMLLKTEKLSVAIHMVTSHMSAQEPLREDLRRMSLRLVKDVRALVSDEQGIVLSDTAHLGIATEAIISGLYVAKSVKLIAQGNSAILESEYHELQNYFIRNHSEHLEALRRDTSQLPPENGRPLVRSIGHISDKRHMRAMTVENNKTAHSHLDGPSRKEAILNIIHGRNSYSLGDIASMIKGVSEKTVQRDLLSLVHDNILKKTGERRWSRYARP